MSLIRKNFCMHSSVWALGVCLFAWLLGICLLAWGLVFPTESIANGLPEKFPIPPKRPKYLSLKFACRKHSMAHIAYQHCSSFSQSIKQGTAICIGSVKLELQLRKNKDFYSRKIGDTLALRTEEDVEQMRGSLQAVGIKGIDREKTVIMGEYHNLRIMNDRLDRARRYLAEHARKYVIQSKQLRGNLVEITDCVVMNELKGEKEQMIKVVHNTLNELRVELNRRKNSLYKTHTAPIRQKMRELEVAIEQIPELKALRTQYLENMASFAFNEEADSLNLNQNEASETEFVRAVVKWEAEFPELTLPALPDSLDDETIKKMAIFSWEDYGDGDAPILSVGSHHSGIKDNPKKGLIDEDWKFIPDAKDRIVFSAAPSVVDTEKVIEKMLLETFPRQVVVDEKTGTRMIGGWTEKDVKDLAVGLVASHERGLMSTDMALANLYRESTMKPSRYDGIGHGESYGLFQLNLDNSGYLERVAQAYKIEYPSGMPAGLSKKSRVKWAIDNSILFQAKLSTAIFNDSMHSMRARVRGDVVPGILANYPGEGFPVDIRGDGNEILGIVHYVGGSGIAPRSTGRALMLLAAGYDANDFMVPLFNSGCKDYPGRPGISQCGEPVHLVSCFSEKINSSLSSTQGVASSNPLDLEECRKTYDRRGISFTDYPISY